MTKQVQLRRGTTAEHGGFTGAVGETTVDTDKDTLVVHDGSTAGGFAMQRESLYVGGYKNKLINGGFRIWQRGASIVLAVGGNAYAADRWFIGTGGGSGAVTFSRQAHALGQTDVPSEPKYFARHDQTAGATGGGLPSINQRIEGVGSLAGAQITVNWYAKVASGTLSVTPRSVQNFGTGGSPSSTVITGGAAETVTTAWQRFEQQISVPSITGKTLGSNGDDYHQIDFQLPTATTFTLDVSNVQVERGPAATRFEDRAIGQELALCQRYAQASGYGGSGEWTTSARASMGLVFATALRAAPTVSLLSGTITVRELGVSDRTAATPTLDTALADQNGAFVEIGGFASATVGNEAVMRSSLLLFDGEL